ncbi:MAG TPA: histone deacetylase [Chloroflexi bacterium]|nr:histone deacetylase [Chloroflexota bacterium]
MSELAFFYPMGHAAHFEQDHPERPERVETIRQALDEVGWWQAYPHLHPLEPTIEVLSAIHSLDYLRTLEVVSAQGRHFDMDTYATPASWQLTLNAAGGAMAVAEAVWRREARRGFALCRPPGHHATANRAMGFCLLNNVALATEHLQQQFGAQKLAIIDLDLHHGNGTQDIFWQRSDVLYISTHQSPLYPGTGVLREIGGGGGEGATANFPMPPMTGDVGFQTVMDDAILPLLDRFEPEMLLVSYGFDTHWRDPLGNLLLTAVGYGSLIAALTQWADRCCEGRIMLVLEGGYDLEAAAACGLSVTAALLGQTYVDPLGPAPYVEGEAWRKMLAQAKTIWGL